MGDGIRNALVLTGLALVLVGSRVALSKADLDEIAWPRALPADQLESPGYHSRALPSEPYVLLIGGSSAHYAFDPDALGMPVRKNAHKRGFPTEVAFSLTWILEHALPPEAHPERIVWAVNRASFVDRATRRPHPCVSELRLSRPSPELDARMNPCEGADDLIGTEDALMRRLEETDRWFGARDVVNDWLAQEVRGALGFEMLPPEEDLPLHFGVKPGGARQGASAWRRLGAFEAGTILPAHERAALEIRELVTRAGVPLTIISMPEHSTVRTEYAPEARRDFEAVLHVATDDVVDLWDALPDEAFYDQGHANEIGRRVATEQLAELLESRVRDLE